MRQINAFMKKLLFIALLHLPFCIFAQTARTLQKKAIRIIAQIEGLKEGDVYKLSTAAADGIDSSVVKNGSLQFRYASDPDGLIILPIRETEPAANFSMMLWADLTDIRITGKASDPASLVIEGSEIHKNIMTFYKNLEPLKAQRNVANVEQKLSKSDSLTRDIQQLYRSEIKQFNNSYYGMVLLYYTTNGKILEPAEGLAFYQKFDKKWQQSKFGLIVGPLLDGAENLKIGKMAPPFSQMNFEGKEIALGSYKGKYVLLDFWASWCGPCRAENPALREVYASFKDKNFEILGISMDTERKAWKDAVAQDKLIWPQISDLKGQRNEVGLLYNINAVPSNYLIDPNGIIIAKNILLEDLKILLSSK